MSEFIDAFQSFRTILCVCPCCNEVVRLSDLHLKYEGKAPKTWLDDYETKARKLMEKEGEFEEKEEELREKARMRGRKKVPKMICKCLDQSLASMKFNPYDIKTIMHPVDFVVFNGMHEKERLKDITFLSRKTNADQLRIIRASIADTINKEKYDWQVARVSMDGKIKME